MIPIKERTIRFKAFHKVRKEIYDVWGITKEHVYTDTLDGIGANGVFEDIKNVILLQYTELNDSNKTEIYHYDIVRIWERYDEEVWKEEPGYGNIEFGTFVVFHGANHDYPGFYLQAYPSEEVNGLSDMICSNEYEHYEVIGNYLTNPELLTKNSWEK